MTQSRNVAILIFDDVEVLDFCGPFEVFAVTGRHDAVKPFNVYIVAETKEPVIARNGLSVNPNYSIHDCPKPDILLISGGIGTRREVHNPVLIDWIKSQDTNSELTLSVCTGALLLGKAGILDGLAATTHYQAFEELRPYALNTDIRMGERFVDNGRVVTSAGISAGIDMSLHIVSRLLGQDVAEETARHMEYDWFVLRDGNQA
jgi:transcriptional regulator GlxA family with amidase domain